MIFDDDRDALKRWVDEGIEPGGFLTAVLQNDLFGAFGKADIAHSQAMADIVKYIWWELPSECWGSEEKMARWRHVLDAKKRS